MPNKFRFYQTSEMKKTRQGRPPRERDFTVGGQLQKKTSKQAPNNWGTQRRLPIDESNGQAE